MSELFIGKGGDGPEGNDKPKIEFPCRYPVKILGIASERFSKEVVDIVRKHAPELTDSDISNKNSSRGRFLSITCIINATGEQQLSDLFEDLKRQEDVKMVL